MREIHIGPTAQVLGVVAVIAAIAAAVVAQLPELRRYLKVKSM
jgi:hypothetical protein